MLWRNPGTNNDSNHDSDHNDESQNEGRGELAPVHYLPSTQDSAGEVEASGREVLEGELITAEQYREIQKQKALERYRGYRRDVVVVGRAVKTVATHQVTKSTGKAALSATVTTWQGFESWGRRLWDASTLGVYRRQIKAAEARGDQDALTEWTERKEQATERRHKRLMDMPNLAWGMAKIALGGLAAAVASVLVVGLFVQLTDTGAFADVITGVLDGIRWIFTAIAVAWTPFVMALPAFIVLGAWREGRKRGHAPGWLATSSEDSDVSIDETTIANALSALRIPQITAYLKQGLPLQFLTPARIDGRGTHAVIRLPAGVPAEKIARRRGDLATGLHRLSKEVWPTTGAEAGILDLWVADKGALAEGAGPYPLLSEGAVDVFKGVPFGKTLRGTPIMAPLMERNTITGGMPGQGKSSAARVIMAGAALDPTAELRIYVPDANFDFEAFKPRCSRYVMGAEDERVAEIQADLEALHAEVQARGDLLVRYEEPAVNRTLASKNVGLHPLFVLLEEAHVAIQHPEHGKQISKLLCDIVRLGRKRGIHMILSTQAPTKDSMPRDVTRNCSNGIAFAVGDHVANDALLGQGAYAGGHRATELIPGTDKGTAVVKGFSGERSDIVQVYFLDVSKDNDQISPIIARAMELIAERGHRPAPARVEIETRDLLADLDAVLGDEPVRSADVPALLAAHAPQYTPYKNLTGKQLREQLADLGIKVPATGNRYPVDPATVRDALALRDQDADDGDEQS